MSASSSTLTIAGASVPVGEYSASITATVASYPDITVMAQFIVTVLDACEIK